MKCKPRQAIAAVNISRTAVTQRASPIIDLRLRDSLEHQASRERESKKEWQDSWNELEPDEASKEAGTCDAGERAIGCRYQSPREGDALVFVGIKHRCFSIAVQHRG